MRPTPALIPRLITYVPHAPHPPAHAYAAAHAADGPMGRPYSHADAYGSPSVGYAPAQHVRAREKGERNEDGGAGAHARKASGMQMQQAVSPAAASWDRRWALARTPHATQPHPVQVASPTAPIAAESPTGHTPPSAPPLGSGSDIGSGSGSDGNWCSASRPYIPRFGSTAVDSQTHSDTNKAKRSKAHAESNGLYHTPDRRTSTVPAPTLAWCDFLSMV